MKIAAISDTHGRRGWTIPSCDVFIHAGDFTAYGSTPETVNLINDIQERMLLGDIGHVLITPGNHDKAFWEELNRVKSFITNPNIHILIDQGIEIDGKYFWGSPWTPVFFDWWFMAEENKLQDIYLQMPVNLDVLITHGPPYGILDPGYQADHVGSHSLLDAINSRNVKHHVFGHLHGAGGQNLTSNNTQFHNVAACNDAYKLKNNPLEFEI